MGQLYKLDPSEGEIAAQPDNTTAVLRLAVDESDGTVWGYSRGKLSAFNATGQLLFSSNVPQTPLLTSHLALEVNSDNGEVWLAADKKLHRFSDQGQLLATLTLEDEAQGLSFDPLTDRLWVATETSVKALDPSGATVLTLSLPRRARVKTLAVDRLSGSVWVALSESLRVFNSSGAQVLQKSLSNIHRLADDGDHGVWAAAGHRLLRVSATGEMLVDKTPLLLYIDSFTVNRVDHSVWVGGLVLLRHVDAAGNSLATHTLLRILTDMALYIASSQGNRPPVAANDSAVTAVNTAISIQVLTNDSDPDSDPLTIASVTQGSNGTVTKTDSIATYTPANNFSGTDSFTYTVSDGRSGTATATVNVTVDRAPVVSAGADQTITLPASATLSGTVTDDGLPMPINLTQLWTKVSGPGTVAFGNATLPNTTASFSLAGVYVVRLTANDGFLSANDEVQVTVNPAPPVNRNPIALNDSALTAVNAAVQIPVLANDSDPDNDKIAITGGTQPANGAVTNTASNVTYTPNNNFSGIDTFTYTIGDGRGGTAAATVTVTVDRAPQVNAGPDQTITLPATAGLVGSATDDGLPNPPAALTVAWSVVSGPAAVTFANINTPATTATFTQAGVYVLRLSADDAFLSSSDDVQIRVNPAGGGGGPTLTPPPLNLSVASNVFDSTQFLYTGAGAVQTGVAPGTIVAQRAAVIRGKVLTRDGNPLSGVTIKILNRPEFGQTSSRADGMFDMAVNGGGPLTIDYSITGFLPAQRQVQVPWQDFVYAADVVLIPVDSLVTNITANAPAMQAHQGSPSTDAEGTRRATLLFPAGTSANMVLPGGATQPLTSLSVRATEYTIGANGPQSMPAELPPTTGYTYAVELSVDQATAAGATSVVFNQALAVYVENFINMPVGENVPLGFYDRQVGLWKGERDGRVVRIVSITAGLADLDTDGNGSVDNGIGTAFGGADLGISSDEREMLASLYSAGQTLWRVPVTHFTVYDMNWPYGPPPDAVPPDGGDPRNENDEKCPCDCPACTGKGSMLEIGNQILGEDIPLVGTGMGMHYRSDRAPGRRSAYRITIPLTGASTPASMKGGTLEITVAGQKFSRTFTAAPGQEHVFEWDGKDAYGRTVQGVQIARLRVGFVYRAQFMRSYNDFAASWDRFSGIPYSASVPRSDITIYRDFSVAIGAWDARAQGIGGWTLSEHHAYDTTGKVLYLGSGARRRELDTLGPVITTVAGNGTQGIPVEGGVAKDQALRPLNAPPLIGAPDGSVYFVNGLATVSTRQIWRLVPNGTLQRFAGVTDGGAPRTGVGALNAFLGTVIDGIALGPDGSVYYSSGDNHTVLRIRPSDQIVELVAGTPGVAGFTGDGGPATSAQLNRPTSIVAGVDGSVYFFDSRNARLRRIGPDGTIVTVAGNGATCTGSASDPNCVSGAPAISQAIGIGAGGGANSLTIDATGRLYARRNAGINLSTIVEIYRIDPDGILRVIAGKRDVVIASGSEADDVDALRTNPVNLGGIAARSDGTVWYTVSSFPVATQTRVRQIGVDGIVRTISGTTTGFGGDGGPARKANLNGPAGLAFTPNGDLFLADFTNNRLRRIGSRFPGFVDVTDRLIASEEGSEVYRFDYTGRHLNTFHGLTGASLLAFAYDSEGRLSTVTDGNGNVTTVQRSGAAPTAIVGPFGQTTQLSTDANGYLSAITNPANETVALSHTANGLLASMTTPKGQTYNFSYEASTGFLLSDADPAGGTQSLARTALAPSATLRDGYSVAKSTTLGRTMQYQVEHQRNRERKETSTATDGTATVRNYKPDGNVDTTAPTGATSTSAQSGDPRWGMLAPVAASHSLRMPSGRTLATSASVTTTLTDPNNLFSINQLNSTFTLNGRNFTSAYAGATKQFTETSAAGRIGTMSIDTLGRPTASQFGGLAPSAMTYDARGRLATVTVGSGAEARTTTFTYNPQSYLETITDPIGRVTSFTYDGAGRPLSQTLPDGRVIQMSYDANGNVATIAPPGRPAHSFNYSPVDLETQYNPPDVVGANPDETATTYNADRQPTLVARPDGKTITPTYDSAGRVANLAFSRGNVVMNYNPTTGLVSTLTAPDGVGHSFTYDGSLLLSHTLSGPVPGTVVWTYDNDFRVASQSVNGANTVNFTYDADSLLTQVGAMTLTRDPQNGLLTGTTLGTVTDSLLYNSHGELSDYRAQVSGSDVYRTQFTRDGLGRITRKIETIQGVTDTYDYSYDPAGRLTGVVKNNTTNISYTYDSNSNRLTYTGPLGNVSTTQYDAQDRLLQYSANTYAYNNHGDLISKTNGSGTTQYTYDEFGNLTRVILPGGTTIDYVIDGMNRRVGKKVNGTLVKRWLYDDDLRIVAEFDGTGGLVSRFVYGTKANVPEYVVQGATTYRLITDSLGSPRQLINVSNGIVAGTMNHDEFGRVAQDTLSAIIPFGFAGGIYDGDTRLIRFSARDYDEENGRWTAKDPVGFNGNSENLYSYVLADPINVTDPTGLKPPCKCKKDHINITRTKDGGLTIDVHSKGVKSFRVPGHRDGHFVASGSVRFHLAPGRGGVTGVDLNTPESFGAIVMEKQKRVVVKFPNKQDDSATFCVDTQGPVISQETADGDRSFLFGAPGSTVKVSTGTSPWVKFGMDSRGNIGVDSR